MCVSIQVSKSLSRFIVSWTFIEFHKERLSFGNLIRSMKPGSFLIIEVSDDLKQPKLSKMFIANKTRCSSGSNQYAVALCSQFGIHHFIVSP